LPRHEREHGVLAPELVDPLPVLRFWKLVAKIPLAQPADLPLVEIADVVADELGRSLWSRQNAVARECGEDVGAVRIPAK
jgi:hypothetical protein